MKSSLTMHFKKYMSLPKIVFFQFSLNFPLNLPHKLTLLAICVCTLPAQAQKIDSIVITANRSEQRSFDVSAAISSVDRETIENAGPQVNLSESLNRIPGLTILNRQNYAQDLQLSIRGFGSRASFGVRGIRLLIDSIPATTPDGQGQASSISLTSTERIEVLRGPLAQMYGNSAGGVIQAFTRDAPAIPELLSQLYIGSYGMRRTDWQYAGRVGDYSLVADYNTFSIDGYRNNSQTKRNQFNGKLSFKPNPNTQVNVVLNRFDMPLAQDPLGLTAAQFADNPQQAGNNALSARVRKITQQDQIGSSIIYTLDPDRSVTARAYYGTRQNLQYQANNVWVGLDRDYYGSGLQYNQKSRIGDKQVSLLAGYDFDYSKERRQGGTARNGEKQSGSITRNENNVAKNSDFFIQATTLATDSVSITSGLRSSAVRFQSEDFLLADGNGSGAVNYNTISPVLGLTLHASDKLNLYANYGKGFETPTLAEVAYSNNGTITSALFNPTLKASKSQHYELGAKWIPTSQSRLDVNLFQILSTDEIVVSTSNAGRTAFKNAPSTSRKGVEISAKVLPHPQVQVSLAGSWIDAKFSQSYSNTNTVASGNKLPGIPQHFIFSELLWSSQNFDEMKTRHNLGNNAGFAGFAGFNGFAGFEIIQAGKIYVNDVNSASTKGYTTLNAKISQSWNVGSAFITAYGRIDNLSNKKYVGSVIVNQAANQFYESGTGRNWTLGLRLKIALK
jgi:iron complex outermembrane receptor protein